MITSSVMNRRTTLKAIGLAALLQNAPPFVWAGSNATRYRPSDAAWPSPEAWQRLNNAVGGNLISISDPLAAWRKDPTGAEAELLSENLKNPYYIGDEP